ncbi:MAG: hypothetical protein QMC23_11980 [Rubritalea sp.]
MDNISGEGVGEGVEGEMGGELPSWEESAAEDGASDDEGGIPMEADPVVADWQGGEEPDR